MNERLKRLLEERANVWSQMTALREKTEDLTAEERESWDKMESRISELSEDIEREQRGDELQREMDRLNPPALTDGTAPADTRDAEPTAAEQYRSAFDTYLRRGVGDLSSEQRNMLATQSVVLGPNGEETRALSVGTNSAGGYTVPPGFRDVLIETQKWYGSVRSVATVVPTDSGQPLQWPTFNGTAQVGRILSENTQLTQTDPAFGTATLNAYMYSSDLTLVPYQFLQDTNIDAGSFLARILGTRIGRIQNQHFTTGTGSSQPLGIQTNATAGVTLPTGNTTTVTYAGLVSLIHSIDPSYRYGVGVTADVNGGSNAGTAAKFMLSDSALSSIRQLTDSQSRPLWQPSVQAGVPDTLLGYSLVLNNDMPAPAANVKSVLFGDFQRGYVVRDVMGVQVRRLDERYADYLQVGWFAFARTDATVQDSAAYKALVQSAT